MLCHLHDKVNMLSKLALVPMGDWLACFGLRNVQQSAGLSLFSELEYVKDDDCGRMSSHKTAIKLA